MVKKRKKEGVIDFLKEYKIISFAIAIVVGQAMGDFIQAIVNGLIMPFLDPLIKGGTWNTATFSIGPFALGWGVVLSKLLNLTILVLIVYIIIKKIVHYKPLQK